MTVEGAERYIAFAGSQQIAAGTLRAVVRAAFTRGVDAVEPVRIFSEKDGNEVHVDLRDTPGDLVARLHLQSADDASCEPAEGSRGPGRPKLGVVAKEVTLLPRHWAWLAAQRGSASAALRRLIDEARHTYEARDAVSRAQDSAYRFTSAMAAGEPTFEEAVRALYRGDGAGFDSETASWPPDVRECSRRLAAKAFASASDASPSGGTSNEWPERR
jgi:hypothetical protein